ncbi:hypothetical protein IV102_14835 [bacterium]|nr:hypothetical protein [bacterium]
MKRSDIWVHSDSNNNLGFFLVFLGAVAAFPLPVLLAQAEIQGVLARYASMLGALLAMAGLALLHFSRKRYRIEPGSISIQDGFFSSSRVFHWQEPAKIQLRSYEDESGEYWVVDLVSGKPHFTLQRSHGHASETRSLAVALARQLAMPLVESSEDEEVIIPPDELELPFAERLKRHPQLLGPDYPEPEGASVKLVTEGDSLRFCWRPTASQILPYFLALVLFIVALGGAPLFPGTYPIHYQDWRGADLQRSAFERASLESNYDYFLLCGGFLVAITLLAAGFRKELRASPGSLSCRSELWGVPLQKTEIPIQEFREIWVRRVRNGAYLQFISLERLVGGRVSDPGVAHWVASRVGRYYAERAGLGPL